jgi:hypothetical protein
MAVSTYSPNQQTKQQLDELDALLQRMLASPAPNAESTPSEPISSRANNPAFSTPPPAVVYSSQAPIQSEPVAQPWLMQSPAPTAGSMYSQAPMATAADAPVEPAVPEPRFFAAQTSTAPAAQTPFPYAMVFGPLPVNQMPAASPPPTNYTPPGGIPAPQWAAPKIVETPPLPVSLWPLYVMNKLFDVVTLPLGPLGSWLRQSAGRNALGWLGVLMILGAIGWGVADWYGLNWTP